MPAGTGGQRGGRSAGAAMLVTFGWHRAATNPSPDETRGHALTLGLALLNRIPVVRTVLGAVMLAGAGYHLARRQRIPPPLAATTPGEGTGAAIDGGSPVRHLGGTRDRRLPATGLAARMAVAP
jgi:hypothetical protein